MTAFSTKNLDLLAMGVAFLTRSINIGSLDGAFSGATTTTISVSISTKAITTARYLETNIYIYRERGGD